MASKKTIEYYYKSKLNHQGEQHTILNNRNGKFSAVNYCSRSNSVSLVVLDKNGVVLLVKVWRKSGSLNFKEVTRLIRTKLNKFGNPVCLIEGSGIECGMHDLLLHSYTGCVLSSPFKTSTTGFDVSGMIIPNIIGFGGDINNEGADEWEKWTKTIITRNQIDYTGNSRREVVLKPLVMAILYMRSIK